MNRNEALKSHPTSMFKFFVSFTLKLRTITDNYKHFKGRQSGLETKKKIGHHCHLCIFHSFSFEKICVFVKFSSNKFNSCCFFVHTPTGKDIKSHLKQWKWVKNNIRGHSVQTIHFNQVSSSLTAVGDHQVCIRKRLHSWGFVMMQASIPQRAYFHFWVSTIQNLSVTWIGLSCYFMHSLCHQQSLHRPFIISAC